MVAVFSVPLMAIWSLWFSKNPTEVRTFRIGLTQLTLVVVAALLFVRQRLIDHDRLRLARRVSRGFPRSAAFPVADDSERETDVDRPACRGRGPRDQ